jgi:hypothetical protein
VEDVLCLTCGGVLRRERDSAGTPNGGPAFQWFDLAGAVLVGANWLDQRQLQRTLLLPWLAAVGAGQRAVEVTR